MKISVKTICLSLLVLAVFACNSRKKTQETVTEERTRIEMLTDYGSILIELYNETPLHRDNFIKLAKEGVLDSVLFHRVIENFMIQAGDPDSKNAQPGDTLGNGELGYKVDAEFRPHLFHKKGALGAARDGNRERASSSTQFYIVQGKVFNDSLLAAAEIRINNWLAENAAINDPANKSVADALQKAMETDNTKDYQSYRDSLKTIAKNYHDPTHYTIPEAQREVYKKLGGTPHLDQNYTVFGEVIEGFEVIDSITAVKTGLFDRPVKDIRIQKVRIVKKELD